MKIFLINSGTGGWVGSASRLFLKEALIKGGVSKIVDMGARVELSFYYDVKLIEKENENILRNLAC